MNIVLEDILRELKPRRHISKGRKRVVIYKRINTAFLTPQWIKRKYDEKGVKDAPNIIKQRDYFIFQYGEYPSFYLSLMDGKLYYAPSRDLDLENIERTASIFLEIIRERVEGFKLKDFYPVLEWEEQHKQKR